MGCTWHLIPEHGGSCRCSAGGHWGEGMDIDALFHLSSPQADATSKVSHRHPAGPWGLLVGGWPLVKQWNGNQDAGE